MVDGHRRICRHLFVTVYNRMVVNIIIVFKWSKYIKMLTKSMAHVQNKPITNDSLVISFIIWCI